MSKRKRTSEIEQWIKQGRGTGIGVDYKPWLKIQDVSSKGRSTRSKHTKWMKVGLEYKSWVLKNVSEFRKLVYEYNTVLDWVEPEGGIVAFPLLKDKTHSSQHFAEKLIASTEVSVLPGEVFERPGHFRIGFGLHPDKFRGAMKLMSKFIVSKGWE